jgi:hypothetical protein
MGPVSRLVRAARFPPATERTFAKLHLVYSPKPYNLRINAYLRAVEKALAEVPPGRRRELLANLSERVEARRSALRAQAEMNDLLELFDESEVELELDMSPRPRDTTHPDGAEHAAAPIALTEEDDPPTPPARRIGALAWVLVVAASMLVMCVAAALTFVFLLVRANLH